MQKGEAKGEEGKEQEKDKEDLNKLNRHHPNASEEQQELEDNLEPTSGLQSLIVDPKPPEGPGKSREEAVKKQEQDTRQTPSPPKVISAETHFQSQAQSHGFQVKSRIQERQRERQAWFFAPPDPVCFLSSALGLYVPSILLFFLMTHSSSSRARLSSDSTVETRTDTAGAINTCITMVTDSWGGNHGGQSMYNYRSNY
ncbi:hypothetical protein F7725_016139 [Dissostichus mawsoni]|uniref:Uncharacterized protein n=1 Tax=Dissostichus mawsoni TaxID=36200 RepID=A0A7J5Y4X0_DISMA|nr:hypothetical protein F7725_016139 [Dissostichus mawsoni]